MRITGGEFKGRAIRTIEGEGYRPATAKVREAVFSMLAARGVDWPEARVVDVFAGSGSLGIEALSRGAAWALFIEKNRRAATVIRENLEGLGIPRTRAAVDAADALEVLARPPQAPFDVAFVDPPYGLDLFPKTVRLLVKFGWLAPEGILLAEVESRLDLSAGIVPESLMPLTQRNYGQTSIHLWKSTLGAPPSTPAPSTP